MFTRIVSSWIAISVIGLTVAALALAWIAFASLNPAHDTRGSSRLIDQSSRQSEDLKN
jgi:hypothetical protein